MSIQARQAVIVALTAATVAALAACSAPPPDTGPLPSLGTAASAAEAQVRELPAPPGTQVSDVHASTALNTFVTHALRVVGEGVELDQGRCSQLAREMQRAIAPDLVFAAAGKVDDPDLRALLLNARSQVGYVLASCADGHAVDVTQARNAVALLSARMPKAGS